MGTATLETAEELFEVGRGDKMIVNERFSFWHSELIVRDTAIVVDKKAGKLYSVEAGEAGEIAGIGTVEHQQ